MPWWNPFKNDQSYEGPVDDSGRRASYASGPSTPNDIDNGTQFMNTSSSCRGWRAMVGLCTPNRDALFTHGHNSAPTRRSSQQPARVDNEAEIARKQYEADLWRRAEAERPLRAIERKAQEGNEVPVPKGNYWKQGRQ